jgi:hypothetical protein
MSLAPRTLRGDEVGQMREAEERRVAHNRQRELLKLERVREQRAEKKRARQTQILAQSTKARTNAHLSAAAVRRHALEELERSRREQKVELWMTKTGHFSDSIHSPSRRQAAGGVLDALPAPRAVVRRIAGGTYERVHSAIGDVSVTYNASGSLGMGGATDRARRALLPALGGVGAAAAALREGDEGASSSSLSRSSLLAQGSSGGLVYDPMTGGFVHRAGGGGGGGGAGGAGGGGLGGRSLPPTVAGSSSGSNYGGGLVGSPVLQLHGHGGSSAAAAAADAQAATPSYADTAAYAHSCASTHRPPPSVATTTDQQLSPSRSDNSSSSSNHHGGGGRGGRGSSSSHKRQQAASLAASIRARLDDPVPLYNPSSGTLRLGPRRPPVPLFEKKPPTPTADEMNNTIDLLERKANHLPEPGDNIVDAGMGELLDEMERFDAHSVQFRLAECKEKAAAAAKLAADSAWAAVRNAEGAIEAAIMLVKRKKAIEDEQKRNVPQNRIRIRSVKEMLSQQGTFPAPRKIRGWKTEGRRKSRLFFSSFSTQDAFA